MPRFVSWCRGRFAGKADLFHLASWASVIFILACDPDWLGDFPVLCPFRRCVGVSCPGCGLVRSWCATAHLRLGEAWAWHPFGPATLALLVAFLIAKPSGERFETWIARVWRERAWVRVPSFLGAVAWIVWAGLRMYGEW